MIVSPWMLLALAVPILLLGEWLVRIIKPFQKLDLPVPVVGGMIVALAVLGLNQFEATKLKLDKDTTAKAWTWLISAEPKWNDTPKVPVALPFSTAFFTCVGLNASWLVARKGGWQLLLLLALATGLGILQNIVGVGIARQLDVHPLMGVLCGSVTLTGGPSTAISFAPEFERAGFAQAAVVGTASAMFGIVCAAILGGFVGGQIIRLRKLRSSEPIVLPASDKKVGRTFLQRSGQLVQFGPTVFFHLAVLLFCIKFGAWVSYWLQQIKVNGSNLIFPVYIGAMIVGILLRNAFDAIKPGLMRTEVIDTLAGILLGIFLAIAMAGLDLMQLRTLAKPMVIILVAQVLLTILFCVGVTFVLMGRDYDAAVTTAGQIGFSLGITPNAVATMDVLTQKFGPSPRAFLTVTIVGGFLIDFTNSLLVTKYLNLLK